MWQNRDFLLTTQRLINLNGTDLKRSIEITKIAALTKNIQAGNKTEFVVHVQGEYDYRFDSPKREEIFGHLKRNYYAQTQKFLPIYAVPGKIQQYMTNAKDSFDMRSTTGVLPPDEYLKDEESKEGVNIEEDLSS